MDLGTRQCGRCGRSYSALVPPALAAQARHARGGCPHRTAPVRCRAAAPSAATVVAPAPAPAASDLEKDPRKGIQQDATQLVGATPMVRPHRPVVVAHLAGSYAVKCACKVHPFAGNTRGLSAVRSRALGSGVLEQGEREVFREDRVQAGADAAVREVRPSQLPPSSRCHGTGGRCRCRPLSDLCLGLRPQREGPDRVEHDKESGGAGPHLPRAHHAGAPNDPQTAPTCLLFRAAPVAAAVPLLLLHLTSGLYLLPDVAACIGNGRSTVCSGAGRQRELLLGWLCCLLQTSACGLYFMPFKYLYI
jgi:hypothetical protein